MSAPAPAWFRPDPLLACALVRWQRAAGPYWPYVCAAPFFGRLADRPPPPRPAATVPALPEALRAAVAGQGLAIFVDQPPTRLLPATPLLRSLGWRIVPIIQRWPARPAVLPCDRLLAQLARYGGRLARPPAPRGVVFLLDGDRTGPARPGSPPLAPRAFDNRYTYRSDRFPPPSLLRQQGIIAVRWLAPTGIAPDLRPYARELAAAGLQPEVLEIPSPPGRAERFASRGEG